MNTSWKTIRVFISSTFLDMQAERDHLVRFVFPRLREELLPRRIHFIDVDLRWGVTSDQDALEVCRGIVDECRPRFLCMLGGRYGWVPPGKTLSITADEVYYGVLDRALKDRGFAYFYFRDDTATAAMVETIPCEFHEPQGSENQNKLANLKRAIIAAGLNPFTYPAQWDDESRRLTGLKNFGDHIYNDLLTSMKADSELQDRFVTDTVAQLDEFAEENAAMEAFVEERLQQYVVGNRQSVLDQLKAFVEADSDPAFLIITGDPGCGKSALLAKFFREYVATHENDLVVSHFVGASKGSTNLRRTLRRLCYELKSAIGSEDPIPEDTRGLVQKFPDLLNNAARIKRVVIIIDGLNQMDTTDDARSLCWLPQQIPGTRAIVSTLEDPILEVLKRRIPTIQEISLKPLTEDDRREITERFLRRYHKRMTAEQITTILDKSESGNPLYLLVALEELRTLDSYQEITDRIRHLPGKIERMFIWILKRLERDPGFRDSDGNHIGLELVRKFTSYLCVSRKGLSQKELTEIINPGDTESDPLRLSDSGGNVAALQRLLRPYLIHRGELIDFYHEQLRKAVRKKYLRDSNTRDRAHASLASYFRKRVLDDRQLEELPWQLQKAGKWYELKDYLNDPTAFKAMYIKRRDELSHYWIACLITKFNIVESNEKMLSKWLKYPSKTIRQATIFHQLAGFFNDMRGYVYAAPSMFTRNQNLGEVLTKASIQFYSYEISIHLELGAQENLQLATTLYDLGELFRVTGEFEKAEQLLRRSLEIKKKIIGFHTYEISKSLYALGLLQMKKGEFDDSELLLRQVLDMRRTILGAQGPETADVLHDLGTLLLEKEQFEEAELLLQEALTIRETLPTECYKAVYTIFNLGWLIKRKGDFYSAERLGLKGIQLCENFAELAIRGPLLSKICSLLSDIYQERKLYRRSMYYLWRAIVERNRSLSLLFALGHIFGKQLLLSVLAILPASIIYVSLGWCWQFWFAYSVGCLVIVVTMILKVLKIVRLGRDED